MHRAHSTGVAIVAFLLLPALPAVSVHAAPRSSPRVSFNIPTSNMAFSIPTSNVAFSGPVLDDRHVVYGVAVPRFHRPVCVSCGQKPFTNFHV